MSAFHCSDFTIDNCVTALLPSTGGSGTDLGKKLIALNIFSLTERYDVPEGEMDNYAHNMASYVYADQKCSDVQNLKSLNCLSYQSCEGGADQTELYKTLVKASDILSAAISSGRKVKRFGEMQPLLPGYDEARWD